MERLEENLKEQQERLGELIADRIREKNPGLVKELQKSFNGILHKYQKPWYIRLGEYIKEHLYKG